MNNPMRVLTVAVITVAITVLVGCMFGDAFLSDSRSRECVSPWAMGARPPGLGLHTPTLEERIAGIGGIVVAEFDSVYYDLPGRAENNRRNLGRIVLRATTVERLKGEGRQSDIVFAEIDLGYDCEYIEDDERDLEKLAELSDCVEDFVDDRKMVMLMPLNYGIHLFHPTASFQRPTTCTNLHQYNPLWLMQAEDAGTDSDPHFYVHWEYQLLEVIPLSEIRRRVQAVVEDEEERGFDCVSASYEYGRYLRSGKEDFYRGGLASDGSPIECVNP